MLRQQTYNGTRVTACDCTSSATPFFRGSFLAIRARRRYHQQRMQNTSSVWLSRVIVLSMSIAFCAATQADAQPVTETAPTGDESTAKVLRLEGRIQLLEARIRELEQQCPDVKRKPTKSNSARTGASVGAARSNAECSPPFVLDAEGMRHVRMECMQSPTAKSCDDPFVLDASGIKRVKSACLSQ